MSGFVRTAIKGKTDATPIVSKSAITRIIKNKRIPLLSSCVVNKEKSFTLF